MSSPMVPDTMMNGQSRSCALQNREGLERREAGHRVVADHHVPPGVDDGVLEALPRVDPERRHVVPGLLEMSEKKSGVVCVVLDEEHAERATRAGGFGHRNTVRSEDRGGHLALELLDLPVLRRDGRRGPCSQRRLAIVGQSRCLRQAHLFLGDRVKISVSAQIQLAIDRRGRGVEAVSPACSPRGSRRPGRVSRTMVVPSRPAM